MPESTRQREAFDLYWRLGAERSIERLRSELKARGSARSARTLYEWSRRYHWQDRLVDLERRAQMAADEERVRAIREMYERQTKEGILLQQKGTEWLVASGDGELSAETAIRAVVEGARLERLARGEPADRIRQEGGLIHGQIDLSSFSLEELRRMVELAEGRAQGDGEADPGEASRQMAELAEGRAQEDGEADPGESS